MTSIKIDPSSQLVDYILFALKTRAQSDISSRWGSNTSLNFDLITEEGRVDIYLIVTGSRQMVSEASTSDLTEIIDRHYHQLNTEDRLMCMVFDVKNSFHDHEWTSDVLNILDFNPGVNHRLDDGKIYLKLDRVVDFRTAFNNVNQKIVEELQRLWSSGIVNVHSAKNDMIEQWDLIQAHENMYIPDWVEPRTTIKISELLLNAIASHPNKVRVTFKMPRRSLVARHNIASWCREVLREKVLFTENMMTINILNVEEFHSLNNFIFLDEPTLNGGVSIFNSYLPSTNVVGEVVYLTSEGYIKSIKSE